VFGLGIFGIETVPQAHFTTEYSDGAALPGDGCSPGTGSDGLLNLTHSGGQTMVGDRLSIVVAGGDREPWSACSGADTEIANQDSAHVGVASDDDVRLVRESGETSRTLVRWNGTAES
jgi:hypothetical protein